MTLAPATPTIHAAALAILVADGLLGRQSAIDLLLAHHAQQPQDPATRASQPKGYTIARVMARRVELEDLPYPEAETAVALAITGGNYDNFDLALQRAADLLGVAFRRLDRLRQQMTDELQTAMDGDDSGEIPEGVEECRHAA